MSIAMEEPVQAICKRARVLLDLGRPADALDEIRRALAINPNDPEALEITGLAFIRLKRHAEALEPLRGAIAGSPWNAHPHYLYAFALRELGRHAEAVNPLESALRLTPEEPVYLRAMAELYADLRNFDEAMAAAARAVEVAPDRAANHVTFGYVASAAGKKPLARAEYEKAVELDPSDAAAWNNLGCLELEAGRLLEARARFRESLRLDPRGERAQRNLLLVTPPRPELPRDWDGALMALMGELVRAQADKTLLAALTIEAPVAAAALVRGGRLGASLTGGVTAVLLRSMGRAALLPIGVGAAAAGAAWLLARDRINPRREQVRAVLARGRAQYDAIWSGWVNGAQARSVRDMEIDLLVESMALELVRNG
jgi:tetratricopeptide (TPR) repeat protein